MSKTYIVDVKAFINVTVEAANEDEARARAEHFVGWLEPTDEFVADYNSDHAPIVSATLGIDGISEVEEDE